MCKVEIVSLSNVVELILRNSYRFLGRKSKVTRRAARFSDSNMRGEEEECPECERKFPDLQTLSDHFDKKHGSSSEDEEKPQELSSKGIPLSRPESKDSPADLAPVTNSESKQSQQSKKVTLVKPRFVGDARVRRVKDVSGATIPTSSGPGDPFLSSFVSFVATQSFVCPKCGSKFSEEEALTKHQEAHLGEQEESPDISAVIYTRGTKRARGASRIKSKEEHEVIDLVDEDPDDANDPLNQHILKKGLPLLRRGNTVSDGNCWYDAVADQVKLSCLDILSLITNGF